jgi:predicted nucleic acid-binding protein
MKPYADTNFFTRLYLQTPDTSTAVKLAQRARDEKSPPLPIIWLHRLEGINAFEMSVFLGRTLGQIRVTSEQAAAASANFREDLKASIFLRRREIPMVDLERLFEELALRHTSRHGFRTYDLLHVASALLLGCDRFWSFDPKASKLAALEGLLLRSQH